MGILARPELASARWSRAENIFPTFELRVLRGAVALDPLLHRCPEGGSLRAAHFDCYPHAPSLRQASLGPSTNISTFLNLQPTVYGLRSTAYSLKSVSPGRTIDVA